MSHAELEKAQALMTSSKPNYFPKAPSPNSIALTSILEIGHQPLNRGVEGGGKQLSP